MLYAGERKRQKGIELVHPVLFHLGSMPIYSYGIMLGLSLIVGWFLSLGLASRDGLPREVMANCYVDTCIAALIGARLLYIATNPADFSGFMSFFQFRNGGLVAYGGFVGGFLGGWASLRFGFGITGLFRLLANAFSRDKRPWRPLPVLPFTDAAAPAIAAGLFITRIGCYLYGCDFGQPLSANAMPMLKKLGTFPRWAEGLGGDSGPGSPAWKHHVDLSLIPETSTASLPVHPTQIYESLAGLALVTFLLVMRKHRKFRGEIFLWLVVLYGFARFLIELVRDDVERGSVPPAWPPYVLFPLCLGLMAIAYSLCVAPRIGNAALRVVTQALAFVPAIAMYVLHRPSEFQIVSPIQLSTSQLVAFLSMILASMAFALLYRGAKTHPEAALALPDFSEWEDGDEDEEEEEEPVKPRKAVKSAAKKTKTAKKTDGVERKKKQKAKSETETETETESATESESESESETETAAETESETETETAAESETATETAAESETETATESETATKPVAKAAKQPSPSARKKKKSKKNRS